MRTKILNKLLPLVENVDYILSEDLSTITPIQKTRVKTETIFHEEVLPSPEHWYKEEILTSPIQPLLEDGSEDTSYTFVEATETTEAHYEKINPIVVYENPNDDSYIHFPEVIAKEAYTETINVKNTIHHEAVEAILDEQGNVITPAVAAYDEVVDAVETYFENLPNFEELKYSLIENVGAAINEWLSTKTFVKSEDDGICISSNGFDWFFKNIEKPKMEELYFSYQQLLAKETEETRKQLIVSTGRKAREACDQALDIISGYNQNRELTPEQITEMATTFTPILNALSILKRPGVAKGLIEVAAVDGVIVTEQMKTDLLDALKDF